VGNKRNSKNYDKNTYTIIRTQLKPKEYVGRWGLQLRIYLISLDESFPAYS